MVNVNVEVMRCGREDGEFQCVRVYGKYKIQPHPSNSNHLALLYVETIKKGTTGWLAPGQTSYGNLNSDIHYKAGYYQIDVSNSDLESTVGCLIGNADVEGIDARYEEGGSDGGSSKSGDVGCYLVISSPKDYEITTTFPLPYSHGFYGLGNTKSQEINSIVDDVFTWIPCEYQYLCILLLSH